MQTIIDTLKDLDWSTVFNFLLVVFIALVGGFWTRAKIKIREMGTLLISFADAVEDNKIDANEKTDLAQKARELIGKK